MSLHPAFYGKEAPLIDRDQFESWLIFEDENVLAFDKPGWVVCHPSKNGDWSSLAGAVRATRKFPHVHLISRLDRETSGIVVFAKHKAAASRLQTAFAKRRTRKVYCALLEGHLEEDRITESQLERDCDSAVFVKQRVCFGGGAKTALTRFRPKEFWGNFTFAEVEPVTGRKHQIRAHAQWLGHPIAGDKIYGRRAEAYLDFIENGMNAKLQAELLFPRQVLHSKFLEIYGEDWNYRFEAPCPFEGEGFRELAKKS